MIRLITNNTSRLQTNLNGKYKILLFIALATPSVTASNVVYFNFSEEIRRNIEGDNYFVADGYFYSNNPYTTIFKYSPQCDSEVQFLECDNIRNINIRFFDNAQNDITIDDWELLIKKVD